MTSVETINKKIQMLPNSSHKEVIDFIDDLLRRPKNSDQVQQASAWEDWAKSHSHDIVLLDDSRETIYED